MISIFANFFVFRRIIVFLLMSTQSQLVQYNKYSNHSFLIITISTLSRSSILSSSLPFSINSIKTITVYVLFLTITCQYQPSLPSRSSAIFSSLLCPIAAVSSPFSFHIYLFRSSIIAKLFRSVWQKFPDKPSSLLPGAKLAHQGLLTEPDLFPVLSCAAIGLVFVFFKRHWRFFSLEVWKRFNLLGTNSNLKTFRNGITLSRYSNLKLSPSVVSLGNQLCRATPPPPPAHPLQSQIDKYCSV